MALLWGPELLLLYNDGYREMFVVNGGWGFSRNDFYWNNRDGTFRRGNVGDLTQRLLFRSWCASADYDGDGCVEVFVPEGTDFWGPLTNRLYTVYPASPGYVLRIADTTLNQVVGYVHFDGDLENFDIHTGLGRDA